MFRSSRCLIDKTTKYFDFSKFNCNNFIFHFFLCVRKLYNQIFVISKRNENLTKMYNFFVHHFFTDVNDVITKNFENFTNKIKKLMKNNYCQIVFINLQNIVKIVLFISNLRNFKIVQIRKKKKKNFIIENFKNFDDIKSIELFLNLKNN